MKQKREDRLLRQWKIRQEAEGHDVSEVKTLEDAENFFKKKKKEAKDDKTEEPPKGDDNGDDSAN